jgi:uncharacterized protein (TIGR02145 family)
MNKRITLAAILAFALALTLSCSDGNDDGDGGVEFNELSQIYVGYYDDNDRFHVGKEYSGSGAIDITSSIIYGTWDNISAGSVSNGIVELELPASIDEKYLKKHFESLKSCDAYKDVKMFAGNAFVLTNSNNEYIGEFMIYYEDEQLAEDISYWYFPKAEKITCNFIDRDFNINAKAGWNKIYTRIDAVKKRMEISTKNILTKELKWIYRNRNLRYCNGNEYDPDVQFCEENEVYSMCDGRTYDPAKLFCYNGITYGKCENRIYDPAEQYCGDGALKNYTGSITDARDNIKYNTIKIGEQIWMAENLRYAEGGMCYKYEEPYCAKYGMLYDWETAMKVCPSGWHLPAKAEWERLADFAGGYETAGNKLKADGVWNFYGSNTESTTDNYGFSALPGDGINGGWWSSTPNEEIIYKAYNIQLKYSSESIWYERDNMEYYFYSVRCVKD